jgi:hypothetical protein
MVTALVAERTSQVAVVPRALELVEQALRPMTAYDARPGARRTCTATTDGDRASPGPSPDRCWSRGRGIREGSRQLRDPAGLPAGGGCQGFLTPSSGRRAAGGRRLGEWACGVCTTSSHRTLFAERHVSSSTHGVHQGHGPRPMSGLRCCQPTGWWVLRRNRHGAAPAGMNCATASVMRHALDPEISTCAENLGPESNDIGRTHDWH